MTELFQQRRRNGFYYTTLPILKLEDLSFRNYFNEQSLYFFSILITYTLPINFLGNMIKILF